MNLEFKEIIDSIRVLPFDEQDYLATMLLEHSDIQEHSEITSKRTVGEYIGKIEISDDFTMIAGYSRMQNPVGYENAKYSRRQD